MIFVPHFRRHAGVVKMQISDTGRPRGGDPLLAEIALAEGPPGRARQYRGCPPRHGVEHPLQGLVLPSARRFLTLWMPLTRTAFRLPLIEHGQLASVLFSLAGDDADAVIGPDNDPRHRQASVEHRLDGALDARCLPWSGSVHR